MKRIIALMSFAFLLMACQKEGRPIVRGEFGMTISAELPELPVVEDDDAQTKASTQYTVRIKWAQGDRLSVVNLTTGKILGGNLHANSSGTRTTFSGSLTGSVNEGDQIAYLYPAQSNAEETVFSSIRVDLSQQQGTTGGVPLCVYAMTTAAQDSFKDASLQFSFLMSYVMLGLSDIPASTAIQSVTITNVTDYFDIVPDASGTMSLVTHTGNIVLTPESSASATGVKTVYAAVPASASMDRNVILQTSTSTYMTAFTSAKLNNGYAYNTNVSGFLVDDLWISDESMREYCLKHFDADADGKLSLVEVAGVREFPADDPIPASVKRFNELEHFHGLTSLPSFKNRTHLQTITIPEQITVIPDQMFYGCTTLIKVILKPVVPPQLGNDVFSGQASYLSLIVPEVSLEAYRSAVGWRDYFNLFKEESADGDNFIDIETEDEGSMGNENADIIV